MKNIYAFILISAALCFAGKLHIDYNDATPSLEINFNEINNIEIYPNGLISIPTGKFSMGQTGIVTPVHSVIINRAYYLGRYEVTQKEWISVMGSWNPDPYGYSNNFGVGDNYPVYWISWYAALVYCNKRSIAEGLTPCYTINSSTDPADWGSIPTSSNSTWDAVTCNFTAKGYRLPTEAEWEYAAQYNDDRTYPWGETPASAELCNFNNNVGTTTVTGSYQSGRSKLGLCDMSGNVSEWTWDWQAIYPSTEQTDPSGPSSGTDHILRGGNFDIPYTYTRCAHRYFHLPYYDGFAFGLRLARTK